LKPERWGSPLVQEKYQEEKVCDRRHTYSIIIIIIIIKGPCVLIDVAISGERNVIKKEAEKILKYKDLTIEIQRMWNVKTKAMPVLSFHCRAIQYQFLLKNQQFAQYT